MSFRVEVSGLTEAVAKLNKIPSVTPKITGEFFTEHGDNVVSGYQSTVPVDTGTLQGGMHGQLEGPYKYVGENDVEYAPFIEEGTSRGIPAHKDLANAFQREVSQMGNGSELAAQILAAAGF